MSLFRRANVLASDSPSIDAFGRWRVSEPVTLFQVQNQYDSEPYLMESVATGSGITPTHSANTRMVAVACNAGSGVSAFQSYEYVPYQPGKSQLVEATFVLGTPVAGAVAEVGVFDAANGILFRQNGTAGLYVVRRTSTSGVVVEEAIAQADWNLDKMDGEGPSGVTLDITTAQILVIDCQFLGMGRVRIGFNTDGQVYYVHEFLNANNLAVPYMQTLSLPVQLSVTATATATQKTAFFKCASVQSEAGFADDLGYSVASVRQAADAGFGGGVPIDTHLMSVRPLTTFNGVVNRSRFRLVSVDILITGAQPVEWRLCVGATFSAAPTWGGVGVSAASAFEQTTAPGTLLSPGVTIAAGYLAASNNSKSSVSAQVGNRYPIALNRAGATHPNGTLSLIVASQNQAASDVVGCLNWTEIR